MVKLGGFIVNLGFRGLDLRDFRTNDWVSMIYYSKSGDFQGKIVVFHGEFVLFMGNLQIFVVNLTFSG
jgi:hypothetical protein